MGDSQQSSQPSQDQIKSSNQRARLGINVGAESILAYFFGFISGTILLLYEKPDIYIPNVPAVRYVKFNCWQSIFISAFYTIGAIIFAIIDSVIRLRFSILSFIWWILFLILWIICMVKSFQKGREKLNGISEDLFKLPLLGNLCENLADRTLNTSLC